MKTRTVLSLAVFVLNGQIARGHETWLIPRSFQPAIGEPIECDITSGMEFPTLGSAIEPTRVARARIRTASVESDISKLTKAADALELRVTPTKPGLQSISVSLHPRDIVLKKDTVAEYMDEIGATPVLRAKALASAEQHGWDESYTKHMKSFVKTGTESDDSWMTPTGITLELVPQADPFARQAGDPVVVQLLLEGGPLKAAPVGLMSAQSGGRRFVATDDDGRASFTEPPSDALLVFCVELKQATENSKWTSQFTTLTLPPALVP